MGTAYEGEGVGGRKGVEGEGVGGRKGVGQLVEAEWVKDGGGGGERCGEGRGLEEGCVTGRLRVGSRPAHPSNHESWRRWAGEEDWRLRDPSQAIQAGGPTSLSWRTPSRSESVEEGGSDKEFDGEVTYVHASGFIIVQNDIYIPKWMLANHHLASDVTLGWRVRGMRVKGSSKDRNRWRATQVVDLEKPRLPPSQPLSPSHSNSPPPLHPQQQLQPPSMHGINFAAKRASSTSGSSKAQGAAPTPLKCTAKVLVRKDGYGFLQVLPDHAPAVLNAFGKDVAEGWHRFNVNWFPEVGQQRPPVRVGDTLSCLISTDTRATAASGQPRIILLQLRLEQCAHLSEDEMRSYLQGVHALSQRDPEDAFVSISSCAAPWRYILQRSNLANELTRILLEILAAILPRPGLPAKKADFVRSFLESRFLMREGPLSCFMLQERTSSGGSTNADELVTSVIEQALATEPRAARAFYHLLEKFFYPNSKLLLGIIRRLLPATVRVEQSWWNELPIVATAQELLGEVDPLEFTPSIVECGPYKSADEYYDTCFRLMRCEGFGELSKGIGALLKGKLDARDMNVYKQVVVCGVRFGMHSGSDAMTIALTYQPLATRGSRAAAEIMFGNLLCISLDGSFKEPYWAVVAHCEADGKGARAFVQLCTEFNPCDDLTALLNLQRCNTTLMAESPTYFNAVRPVLKALQTHDPDAMPFRSELVEGRRPSTSDNTDRDSVPAPRPFAKSPSFLEHAETRACAGVSMAAAPNYIQPDAQLQTAAIFPQVPTMSTRELLSRLREPAGLQTSFDESQRLAIAAALQQRVTVIQGPPGTGKSFIGRELACMLAEVIRQPILVMTYKNHALDEFLEGCIDRIGEQSIARLGSRSKSPRLMERNVRALLRDRELTAEAVDSRTQDGVRDLRAQLQALVPQLVELMGQRRAAAFITSDSMLVAFLAQTDDAQLRQLWLNEQHGLDRDEGALLQKLEGLVAPDADDGKDPLRVSSFRQACSYCVQTEQHIDAAARVALRGAANLDENITEDVSRLARKMVQIFQRWAPKPSEFASIQRRGRPSVLPNAITSTHTDVSVHAQVELSDEQDAADVTARRVMAEDNHPGAHWKEGFISLKANDSDTYALEQLEQPLAEFERQTLRTCAEVWSTPEKLVLCHMLLEDYLSSLDKALRTLSSRYVGLLKELKELEEKRTAEVLRTTRLVGMTSTCAALNMGVLANLRPQVVIVEEAAELLEPQLLAVLSPGVQHLILIGDHEQLRPQVAHHELVRKHFDVSMFERLVKNGMLSQTLQMQSRMRPEMVELLRHVYPHVENHPRVYGSEHRVPACLRHSMYFWTHKHLEQAERSVSNEQEAQMVMQLVDWLTSEGQAPETITVIAAYSQQVRRIRELVKERSHLMKAKVDFAAQDKQGVSVALLSVITIDEFQGDENEVIICSLVRSWTDSQAASDGRKTIGYLKVRNRLVVAASRAKRAQVFVGNADWLESNTKSSVPSIARWDLLIQTMRTQGLVGGLLPLRCPRHMDVEQLTLSAAEKRLPKCPMPCASTMDCGLHPCQVRRCHPALGFEDAHSTARCKESVDFKCVALGHPNTRICCDPPPDCERMVRFAFGRCKHGGTRKCCTPESDMRCEKQCERKLECGHPCALKCWEDCSKAWASCTVCADIRKAKEDQAKRQFERAKILACKTALEEAEHHRGRSSFRKKLEQDDPAYMEACRIVHQNQQPDHRNPIVVVAVEQVYNSEQQVKFLECTSDMVDPTPAHLYKFHGTSKDGVDGICRDGFRQPDAAKPNMDKKSGGTKLPMYGHGIYLASDSTKSAQEEYTCGSNMLLVCKTRLGKSLPLDKPDNHLDLKKMRKMGFDSVFARAGTAVRFDEFIVYDARQCVVEWVVHFKKGNAKPAATPWNLNGQTIGDVTCRKLVARELGSRASRELEEFTFAHGHYARLLEGNIKAVKEIDVYDSPKVKCTYEAKKNEFQRDGKSTIECWVFHGCPDAQGTASICKDGFKIGGQDGHRIKNGSAYGRGVYSATGPDTPMSYGHNSIILCKALVGNEGPQEQGDHWKPLKDWIIFRTAAQLLPKYVVHFT